MTWAAGQSIVVIANGRRMPGAIVFASANGRSLAVTFDGIIGGWVGGAALLWREDARQFETLTGEVVSIEHAFGPEET
jgi:hypothetical protein